MTTVNNVLVSLFILHGHSEKSFSLGRTPPIRMLPVAQSVDPRPENDTYLPTAALEGQPGSYLWPTIPVPCRNDFAPIAQRFFNQTGWAAEIGVQRGRFAQLNLGHWMGRYYMIDMWDNIEHLHESIARVRLVGRCIVAFDEADCSSMQNVDGETCQPTQLTQCTRLPAGKAWIIRGLSIRVASQFQIGVLDWIYIDAGHGYKEVLADLVAWYPKVRQGGLVSGDDYGDDVDVPHLRMDRYWKSLNRAWGLDEGALGRPGVHHWGVIRAVTEFARSKGHHLHVTFLNDCYFFPAWYFVKA